jgi:hypothetical protein
MKQAGDFLPGLGLFLSFVLQGLIDLFCSLLLLLLLLVVVVFLF